MHFITGECEMNCDQQDQEIEGNHEKDISSKLTLRTLNKVDHQKIVAITVFATNKAA